MTDEKRETILWFVGEHVRATYNKVMPSGDVKTWVATGKCLQFAEQIVILRDNGQGLIMFQQKHMIDIEQTPTQD